MAKMAVAEKSNDEIVALDAHDSSGAISTPLFPLALTPFEKYFLWDDRPEQPLTPILELQFSTPLNRDALEHAIAQVIAKNPTLNSLVVRSSRGLHWELLTELPKLWCPIKDPIVVDGKLRPFDLAKEPGCRFWYEESESGSRLLWQVHHAVTDGVGMRPVVIDILLHYAMATSGESVERYSRELYCSRFKAAELLRRSDFSHLPKSKRSISTWQRIKNAKYFHFMRPRTLLGSGAQSASSVEDRRVLCLASLDAELSERVFAKCSANSVAIHELAMALLFRTCAEWNRSCGDRNPKSHIRLMMPVDLRDRRDLRMPAANRLSFMFFGRSYQQCDNFGQLLESVQKEFAYIKETQLYLDFFNMIRATSRWSRLMQWGLRRSDSMATAVLTYVGDVTRGTYRAFPVVDNTRPVGDAILTSIAAAPPVRRNTNISLGLGVNWGQIHISAAWNRYAMTALDCEKFLELYKSGWQRWCDEKE